MADPERALRFDHPDRAGPGSTSGLRVAADGRLDTVSGNASVRQALFLLLSTRPGERVMRPDYGCALHRLMFAENNTTTAGLAIYYVRRAVERWEPRVEILHLDAAPDALRPNVLALSLTYRVRSTQQTDRLAFSLSLNAA